MKSKFKIYLATVNGKRSLVGDTETYRQLKKASNLLLALGLGGVAIFEVVGVGPHRKRRDDNQLERYFKVPREVKHNEYISLVGESPTIVNEQEFDTIMEKQVKFLRKLAKCGR